MTAKHKGKVIELEEPLPGVSPRTPSGDLIMGNVYTGGQAGAVGPGAHAHDMTFNQIWNETKNDIDLSVLAKELAELYTELKKEASEPEHDISIGAIVIAEGSAKEGNGPKTLEYLSKAGKWALDVATTIGIPVATEALKKVMEL